MYTRQDLGLIEEMVDLEEKWVEARLHRAEDPEYYQQTKDQYRAFRQKWREIREALAAGMN